MGKIPCKFVCKVERRAEKRDTYIIPKKEYVSDKVFHHPSAATTVLHHSYCVGMDCYLHPLSRVTEITPQVPLQVVPISVRSEAEGTHGTTSKGTRGVISVTRDRGWR